MAQFEQHGVDPQEAFSTMMKDPELMKLMSKPNVVKALMDIQNDPNKAAQYMADPDVSQVLMKMSQIQMNGMAAKPSG